MTAPAAPRISANQDGTIIYVRWLPNDDTATDYNVYVQDAGSAAGIEVQVDAALDINPDGWYFVALPPDAGVVTVWVTALNVLAEESASSNTVQKNLMGAGFNEFPSGAISHIKGT